MWQGRGGRRRGERAERKAKGGMERPDKIEQAKLTSDVELPSLSFEPGLLKASIPLEQFALRFFFAKKSRSKKKQKRKKKKKKIKSIKLNQKKY